MGNRKSKMAGAVAAELAVLTVFVYVPLVIGAIYVGWLALGRDRVHEANHYALLADGDQSELFVERGDVTRRFFGEFTGEVRVRERQAEDPEVPGPTEVRDLFEEYARTVYWRTETTVRDVPSPPRASGGFSLGGGGITYDEDIDPGRGGPVSERLVIREGWNDAHPDKARHVRQLRLLEDSIPEHLTEHLIDYLRRVQARSIYRHSWVHDDGDPVGGNPAVRGWNLEVPAPDPAGRVEWNPATAIRGHKVRMARDQTPPGADLRHNTGFPVGLPGYEPDTDFMHPK